MHAYFASLIGAVCIGTLVSAQNASKTYALEDFYQGQDFFTKWTFFTDPDPTHGNVKYLDMQDAEAQHLAYVSGNVTTLAVDSTSTVPVGGQRDSVRITSLKTYTGGLFILDVLAVPTGCGVWPSFWSFGPSWPNEGEIDIVEGVNNQMYNQMTLHTGSTYACTVDPSKGDANTANTVTPQTNNATVNNPQCNTGKTLESRTTPSNNGTNISPVFSGHVLNPNCNTAVTENQGCAVQDSNPQSFGPGFNAAGGGVYVMLWDNYLGIKVWRFTRGNVPQDIANKNPTPSNWGMPAAAWGSATCNIAANFQNHQLVFDTTICGDWAGQQSVYSNSTCPGTCAQMVANATNFVNAKWEINYVAVYQ